MANWSVAAAAVKQFKDEQFVDFKSRKNAKNAFYANSIRIRERENAIRRVQIFDFFHSKKSSDCHAKHQERERDKESQKRIILERPFNVNNSPIVTQDAVDLASTLFCPNGTEPL